MSIDIDELDRELQKCGTDARIARAIMTLARHTNEALAGMKSKLEDIADDRISEHSRREAYYKALEGS